MANKIHVKQILELHDAGVSRNAIASSRHMSRSTVSEVIQIARQKDITYSQIADQSDDEVYRMFYPDKFRIADIYAKPDFELVHQELGRTGVRLKTLWGEYKDNCNSRNLVPMGYTRFCEQYRSYTVRKNLTSRVSHRPGERCEVDWSGPGMKLIDPNTGEIMKVYLFVACLPYSQYTYVEPVLNMKMESWINCHINMYRFFGGVPARTICDNLKTGVVSHPREGDVVLTEEYEALGMHYVTAIMPAPVRKPKAKASVEGNVGKIAIHMIAPLRNHTFYSLGELKAAVSEKLKQYNDAPFQKREGSRSSAFEDEKAYLRPLPAVPFEMARWDRGHKIDARNFHVSFEKNYYSVPWSYAGRTADLRITDHSVEVFVDGKRVAVHNRFPAHSKYKYATLEEHMPPEMLRTKWSKERIIKWAEEIGPFTKETVSRIFASCQVREQGYNPALSVLKLSDRYSQERLEAACELALSKYHSPRYRHINALLSAKQDILWKESQKTDEQEDMGYLRGADYYERRHGR